MTFLSPQFFGFFLVTVLVYFPLPRRFKNPWLLLASCFFYLCAKPIYMAFLLFAILSTYSMGRILETRKKKSALVLCLLLNAGLLFLFKYLTFTLELAGRAMNALGFQFSTPVLELLLPLGISFYLFQGMGYVIDVYRGKVKAERNVSIYALFLSFFPQIVSGPIGRAEQMLPQFREEHRFSYENLRRGLLRFLWGAFQKAVIADRIALLVNTVFETPDQFGALQLMGAAVAFSIQIYCDFSAYSHMALGVAKVLGFELMENFRTPYFARSMAEFWRRWHISLSSWFRDYLYFPLGGSRRGSARKYANILVVFAVSGLWHGAALTFLVWGLLNGLFQVVGGLSKPARDKVRSALRLKEDALLTQWIQIGITFTLSTLAWVFFKAGSLLQAMDILKGMVSGPLWAFQSMGLEKKELLVGAVGIFVLFFVEGLAQKRDLMALFLQAKRPVRWIVLWGLLFAVLLFGSYGTGYDAQAFIYVKF